MNSTIHYDRTCRLWVVILRDENGYGIPDPITGEEANYFPTKQAATAFMHEVAA